MQTIIDQLLKIQPSALAYKPAAAIARKIRAKLQAEFKGEEDRAAVLDALIVALAHARNGEEI